MEKGEIEKAIEKCYTEKPLGLAIRTEEDAETIRKLAAVLKEHKTPLHINHMKWLLKLTFDILENAMLDNAIL